jgi:hypothetical protein
MPRSSLSQQDRNRFEQLLQGPLIPPTQDPKDPGVEGVVRANATSRLTAMKRHLMAHSGRWAAGAIAVAGLAIVMVAVKLDGRGHTDSIQLQALDKKGQLQIRWNPDSNAIRRAVSAKLYIIDGSDRLFVKLDDVRLRLGNVKYARNSGRVELRMELAEPDGRQVEEQATFVGPRPSTADELPLEMSKTVVGVQRVQPASAFPPVAAKPVEITGVSAPSGHRTRRKSLEQSGTKLPFTCSEGDTFHKTDSPAGWDTFTCHGKNVWGLAPVQTRENRPAAPPGSKATTLTAKPAEAPTT